MIIVTRNSEQRDYLTTNKTNFHEWEAASLENFTVGVIRVYSENSWFKCSALGHPIRTGSFVFPADQDFFTEEAKHWLTGQTGSKLRGNEMLETGRGRWRRRVTLLGARSGQIKGVKHKLLTLFPVPRQQVWNLFSTALDGV